MSRFLVSWLLILAGGFASAQAFTKVQVVFLKSGADGKFLNPPKMITLSDPKEVSQFRAFLKGLGVKKGPMKAGGWDAWGTATLMRPGGKGVKIFFARSADRWSQMGNSGDYVARIGFRDYLAGLEKSAIQK